MTAIPDHGPPAKFVAAECGVQHAKSVRSPESMEHVRAGIALGSNLGARCKILREARTSVEAFALAPVFASALYETAPVNCEPGAPPFLNAVIEIGYGGSAFDLLIELRTIEAKLGRPPEHARNTSRTVDLDLLYFGDSVIATHELQLPHPRMQTRRFVLQPLSDIRPDLRLPGQREDVATLLAQLSDAEALVCIASRW